MEHVRKRLVGIKRVMQEKSSTLSNPFFIFCFVWLVGWRNEYIRYRWCGRRLLGKLLHIKPITSFRLTGTGVLLLFSEGSVVKVPLSRIAEAALQRNFYHYRMLKESHLSHYVSYRLEPGDGFYRMDRLCPVSDPAEAVASVVGAFEALTPSVRMPVRVLEEKCATGVAVLQCFSGMNIQVPVSAVVHTSAMHGDLTEHNVMTDAAGRVVLIDLERFDFNGIAGIDLIHFDVNRECTEKRCSFTDCLPGFVTRGYDRDTLIVYLLYRLGVEHNDEVRLPDSYYRRAYRAYECLLAVTMQACH